MNKLELLNRWVNYPYTFPIMVMNHSKKMGTIYKI